jgi:succinate dehydrogenase / fumarate reductase membrane anchor subunit
VKSKSPLGTILGLGGHSGTHHWWMQKVTSIALALLGPWFVITLLCLPDYHYATVHAALARPMNAVLTSLFLITVAHHSAAGISIIIEDYVPSKPKKLAALLVTQFLHWVLAGYAVLSVLKVALGSAA